MSKSNKNIEDLFRSNFENYKVEPSFDAWDKIDSRLSGYGFNNYFRKLFNSHRVSPSANLWPKIARKVWLANFVKYQPFTFNIYNTSTISAVVFLLIIGFNNSEDSKIINENSKTIAVNTPLNTSVGTKAFITEVKTSFNENISSENNKTNGLSQFVKKAFENSLNGENIEIMSEAINPSEIIKNKYIIESHKSQILNKKSEVDVPAAKQSTVLVSKSSENSVNSKLKSKSDTVGVNAQGKPIIMERQRWSYDVYTALVNSQSVYKTDNKEFEKFIKDRESKQSPLLSYSVGMNVNYEYYGFTLQGGLSYSQLGHNMNFLSKDSSYNSNNYFSSISDSVGFSGDSLYLNDTISSILLSYNNLDSIAGFGSDSSLSNKLSTKNKYRYFEIPLTVSYSVKQNNFTFGVTGGLITGLFINVSGVNSKNIKTETQSTELKKENPYAVPNFSSYLGLYLGYELNHNSQIFLEPYYRKSLNSIYTKETYFTQKFTAYGARVGLRYSF